jgi:putative membrane protein insertion efficiency factor
MKKQFSPLVSRLSLLLVRMYQLVISPLKPHTCRYAPTCSRYALEVLRGHPPAAALKLIFRRVISCHPWGGYGYDPPPETLKNTQAHHE